MTRGPGGSRSAALAALIIAALIIAAQLAGCVGRIDGSGGGGDDGDAAPPGSSADASPVDDRPDAGPGNPSDPRTTYQAERGFLGGAARAVTGSDGTGHVEGLAGPGDRVVFTVVVDADSEAGAHLRYRNPGAAAEVAVEINGLPAPALTLAPATDAAVHDGTLALRAGLNTVALIGGAAAIAIDSLEIVAVGGLAARGATVPFVTYEAEAGTTSGEVIGPDRAYHTVPAEASGRRAVTLTAAGAFVEHTTDRAANAIVVRYSIADSADGAGTTGSLGVYVDGDKRATLALSSRYAWLYGAYPFGNDPAGGLPHRYFDDVRALIGDVPAGATVRLQKEAGDAAYVTIDLVDLEQAPAPYPRPDGSLSIVDYGATADDDSDDTEALRAAIADAAARGQVLWIPAGAFRMTSRLDVGTVTIRGAGPWHSVLRGTAAKGGFYGTGGAFRLFDVAVFGDVTFRDDAAFDSGIDNALGAGSMVQNVWFEHTKVGIWTIDADNVHVVGCRVRNTFADGVNLTDGTRRTVVEHVHLRNTGDDALAMWSAGRGTDGNTYRFNTATLPMLANGIAVYGGNDHHVEDNLVSDTVFAAAGIAISTRAEFSPQPFGGVTVVARNTITRAGGFEENWNTAFGGLWVFANASAITSRVEIRDLDIVDSTYQGVLLSGERAIEGVLFERVRVDGAGTVGIEIGAAGNGTFNAVAVDGADGSPATITPGFQVTRDAASVGW